MKIFRLSFISFSLIYLLAACSGGTPKNVNIPSVKVDTIIANNEKNCLQYPGRVEAAREVDLSFRVSGKITRIYVKDGQAIKTGQLLAEMDASDYEVQLAATEAKYSQVKAEAERVIALYKDGGSTPNDYDKAVYGLRQIEALLKHHRDEVKYTKLYAPFDGFIQKQYFSAHETVGAGMPVVSLIGNGAPEVEIHLPAAEYIRRDLFSDYHCTFDIYPGKTFPLQLIGITHKANPNQLYTMRLKINAEKLPLPAAGMNTTVTINYIDANDHSLQVPTGALLHADEQSWVFVWNADKQCVKRHKVKVIRPLNNGKTIISSDEVKSGDIIVVAGIHGLKDGQAVRPLATVSNTNVGGLL